mmetsp:Transcript_38134/g.68104  ORF Transcript_38134/g.68104 Transcript_38134/m.68104 type:complete len:86 (-) Transcript_38134:25-282(-)
MAGLRLRLDTPSTRTLITVGRGNVTTAEWSKVSVVGSGAGAVGLPLAEKGSRHTTQKGAGSEIWNRKGPTWVEVCGTLFSHGTSN